MRYTLIYIELIVLFSACGQRSELVKNNWLVVDGTYMGQPIEFHSTDSLKFLHRNGSVMNSLNFSKDETIILPGINSPNISAKWVIEDDKIGFTLDSSRYSIYTAIDSDLSFLASDSIRKESKVGRKSENAIVNPSTTKEFKKAMEIYGQSFKYHISLDTLVLEGQKGKIRAVRDRTIDDLVRNL